MPTITVIWFISEAREAKLNAYEHTQQQQQLTQMVIDSFTLQEEEVVSEVITDETNVSHCILFKLILFFKLVKTWNWYLKKKKKIVQN